MNEFLQKYKKMLSNFNMFESFKTLFAIEPYNMLSLFDFCIMLQQNVISIYLMQTDACHQG